MERALLPTGWAQSVTIDIDQHGVIAAVKEGTVAAHAELARGPVVPAMPNVHSHAFQRAMAGLAEVSAKGQDNFWTWREAMYHIVGLLTPEDFQAIA